CNCPDRCRGARIPAAHGSEGRVVVPALVAASGPRVGVGTLRGAVSALATEAALLATAEALTAALLAATEALAAASAALDLGGLGRGISQCAADLVDIELGGGAVVALAGGEGALLQTAQRDHAGARAQRLSHVLRGVARDRAAQEQSLPVPPL